jgi:hypothetical protein
MEDHGQEAAALQHIQRLVAEEHQLFEQGSRSVKEDKRLADLQVQLDQCWDLLRQRRALRETGRDPGEAHLRPPEIVEKYVG